MATPEQRQLLKEVNERISKEINEQVKARQQKERFAKEWANFAPHNRMTFIGIPKLNDPQPIKTLNDCEVKVIQFNLN